MKSLQLAHIKHWWAQRPAREKLMLSACSLGVVLALGDSLGISPVEKRLRAARLAEEQLQSKWDHLQARRKGSAQQDQQWREQEAQLRARLQAAQKRVGSTESRLQETNQLPDVLRAITATMGNTKLLALALTDDAAAAGPATPQTSLANAAAQVATTVATPGADAGNSAGTAPARRIYQLPITLKVSGSWDELTQLLSLVESRAPALQWKTLSLDSSDWPAIQLTLRAQVPSLQPRWGAAP